jgi:cytochrome bd ubiquinol oxidase subunit II
MFETISLLHLQQYWWILVSILGSLLVFLMFVQGGQTFLYTLPKTPEEKKLLINSIGHKWEFTFTTLVTFGGAIFAAFPLFYATSFGGAYWVWLIILFCFIIQAVSFEFRSKPKNFLGTGTYDFFLFLNGSLGVLLIGAAVSTFFTGSSFSVNAYNLSTWQNSLRGLEAAFNLTNLALGLSVFFLARILGLLYFINNINNENIYESSKKKLLPNAIVFLILFIFFIVSILLKEGFAYDIQTKVVSMESYKYFHNLLEMPIVLVLFLMGVVLVITGIVITLYKKSKKGIWFSGSGTILAVFSLFLIAGLNNTAFYPSVFDLQSSLTIENSSSSKYTLTVMSYVSLLIPFVIAYIYFAWKAMDKKKLDIDELNKEDNPY